MPAVAVTDHGNLFGAIGFYDRGNEGRRKAIIGCEMYVAKTDHKDRDPASGRPNHLIVLCENERGYQNLVKLVSKAYLDGFITSPRRQGAAAGTQRGTDWLSAALMARCLQRSYWARRSGRARRIEYQDIFGKGSFLSRDPRSWLEKQRKIIPDMLKISERTGIRRRQQRLPLHATG
jgi:DNA polymerase-3 subunit alpha